MTYLITGGAGFIGSHSAAKLLENQEQVVILDNFNDYYDPALKRKAVEKLCLSPNLTLVEGDIRNVPLVNQVFAEHEITHVVHLAAMAGVRLSVNETPLYVDVNVVGTMNILEAARDHRVKQVVMASTSSVYGATENLPFVETDTADRPLASYPASKRSAEILAHTYYHLFGMNITTLRFFNVYGPAGRPDMMPIRLMNATIDGTLIKLFNNGDIHRDWTYIDDTVNGVLAALHTPLGYEVINLGVGSPISLRDFVDLIEEYSGRQINTISIPTPASDPPITYCNNDKARELLSFAPAVKIQEGLLHTWQWFAQDRGL